VEEIILGRDLEWIAKYDLTVLTLIKYIELLLSKSDSLKGMIP
jgi:hypothetical protein